MLRGVGLNLGKGVTLEKPVIQIGGRQLFPPDKAGLQPLRRLLKTPREAENVKGRTRYW